MVILVLVPSGFLPGGCSPMSGAGLKAQTFEQLNALRRERKLQVEAKLENMRGKVADAVKNPILTGAFERFMALAANDGPPAGLVPFEDKDLDRVYLEEYYYFYDILFIDSGGLVFHTIRRESGLGMNIFKSEISSTLLAQRLKSGVDVAFVDYHYYSPSREPASFFVAPMRGEGGFLLSCPTPAGCCRPHERGGRIVRMDRRGRRRNAGQDSEGYDRLRFAGFVRISSILLSGPGFAAGVRQPDIENRAASRL